MNNTIAFDIDNTICSPISKRDAVEECKNCEPRQYMINLINALYDRGYRILFFTHRTKSCDKETRKWLKKYKVKYHEIKYDKPAWLILIDDKTYPPFHYLGVNFLEGYLDKISRWDFETGFFKSVNKSKKKEKK